jgi:hypothetical protein
MQEVNNLKHDIIPLTSIEHLINTKSPPSLDQKWYLKDRLGLIGVRLNINRDHFKVTPGLYKLGSPDENSDVIVTANYKLTFDQVRRSVHNNYWLLVIDTDGINVWCAAGKGRFGTAEVIYWLNKTDIKSYIHHKRLILPQLSGPGIQSHLIEEKTGLRVYFGPVDIKDLDRYVSNQYQADHKMRTVDFKLKQRLSVMGVECLKVLKLLVLIGLLSLMPFIPTSIFIMACIGGVTGSVLFPILLPIRPFAPFYLNGFMLSAVLESIYLYSSGVTILKVGLLLLFSVYAGFLAMNFTGSTTFTSLSGVKKEMERGVPFLVALTGLGVLLTCIGGVLWFI